MSTSVIALVLIFFVGLLVIPLACCILSRAIHIATTADAAARHNIAYWGIFFLICWAVFIGIPMFIALMRSLT